MGPLRSLLGRPCKESRGPWGGLRVPSPCPPLPFTLFSVRPSQDKLSSQGFGTDLPLVDNQVEQHNIFHNEVKAIGPHLAKDGGKVDAGAGRHWDRRGSHAPLP